MISNFFLMVEVNVGEYAIIETGLVSVVSDSPIVLKLDPRVIIRIVFETDSSEGNQSKLKSEINSKGELEFTLTNFNNPLGTEFTQYAEIGRFNGRKLFFHVKVLGNGNVSNNTVIYSFLQGGQVTNG